MIGGLWNGVTGLNTFEKALETQSNNVTNSNTIAHKNDEISFEDLMYQSRFGNGVRVQGVEKNFAQGELQITNNALDVAIEGDGFFVVDHKIYRFDENQNQQVYSEEKLYTRAGNFKMGTSGVLETVDGKEVLGTVPNLTTVSTDGTTVFNANYTNFIATEPISSPNFSQTINAKSTNYRDTAVDSGVSGTNFKTASGKIADIEALITDYNEKLDLYASNPTAASTASTSQVVQLNYADFQTKLVEGGFIEVNVNGLSTRQYFDTDPQTTMNLFADKISNIKGLSASVDNNGTVSINSLVPGKDNRILSPAIDNNGYGVYPVVAPTLGSGIAMVNSSRDALKTALENADAKFLEMSNMVGADSSATLNNVEKMQLKLDSLNISENVFGELSIENGLIYSKDSDNKFLIGRLDTFYFPNPDSLDPEGGTFYSVGKDTGEAKNAHNINNVVGKSLELSNTSFSEDLVDLMVYQRAFEASSKSITTSDEFLRTAIELKK